MTDSKMKIGLMGGTFDPIHFGHLFIANEIKENLNLNKIIFIPTGNPPHKNIKKISDAYDRYLMTLLATLDTPYFEVSKIETNRKEISYTIDTIDMINNKHKDCELFFIIGADSLFEIKTWKNFDKLLKKCNFIVTARPGYKSEELETEMQRLNKFYNTNLIKIDIPQLEISSTEIRKRIELGKTIKYHTKDSVIEYIYKKKLYKKRNNLL